MRALRVAAVAGGLGWVAALAPGLATIGFGLGALATFAVGGLLTRRQDVVRLLAGLLAVASFGFMGVGAAGAWALAQACVAAVLTTWGILPVPPTSSPGQQALAFGIWLTFVVVAAWLPVAFALQDSIVIHERVTGTGVMIRAVGVALVLAGIAGIQLGVRHFQDQKVSQRAREAPRNP